MSITATPTINYEIFMAGDYDQARQICREFCLAVGFCVTVTPTSYIYTGGEESGVRVGIINYPRFPKDQLELRNQAYNLAQKLMIGLCQHTFSIVGPDETEWFSRRTPETEKGR